MRRLPAVLLISVGSFLAPCGTFQHIAAAQQAAASDGLSDADLEELLAPIALYPDPLLANVLTACCYPD